MTAYFWSSLEKFGDATALLPEDEPPISYRSLAFAADEFSARLPSDPQLVALEVGNHPSAIAAYLGCLRAGHAVILLNKKSLADGRIIDQFEPNWLFTRQNDEWSLSHHSTRSAALHPDLAVLLSTSGTTGAPKLVRLSAENIASNANSISQYLALTPSDRTLTSLEFAYSFGMASMNSQLCIGGSIALTEAPITSEAFWDRFRDVGATSISLVPFHFELLERLSFEAHVPSTLRIIRQAGGKLAPHLVSKYHQLGKEHGFQLFVMYGQTEAAPRMAYVPPDALSDNLDSIGCAVPGGEFWIRDLDGNKVDEPGIPGELIYRGPNVMLGYAEARSDLAKPRELDTLSTGDLALRKPNGYFKIVGRMKRFVKIYGLRINLDDVETQLRAAGFAAYVTGDDQRLAVFQTQEADQAALLDWLVKQYGLRPDDIVLGKLDEVPLLSSGKVDYADLKRRLQTMTVPQPSQGAGNSVIDIFQNAFPGRDIASTDTFASLGGDSLTYVGVMLGLEKTLGEPPENWDKMEIGALQKMKPKTSAFAKVPIDMIVRVTAIIFIVSEHLQIVKLFGGALTLMMLAGFTAARFSLQPLAKGAWREVLWKNLSKILVVYYALFMLYFAALMVLDPDPERDTDPAAWIFLYANFKTMYGHMLIYWFICAFVQVVVFMCLAWAIPSFRSWLAADPIRFGVVAVIIGLCGSFAMFPILEWWASDKNFFAALAVFGLGWMVACSRSIHAKLIATFVLAAITSLFWFAWFYPWHLPFGLRDAWAFGNDHRILLVVFSSFALSLIWLDRIPMPRLLGRAIYWLGSISFFIYVMHLLPMVVLNKLVPAPAPLLVIAGKWAIGVSTAILLAYVATFALDKLERRGLNRNRELL